MTPKLGFAGRIAHFFIDSKLTPLIIAASVMLGLFAVAKLPREEEPQIIVPMIDIMVQAPGMSPKEVEQRVTSPMEKLLWEIPGVEYVYSTSSDGMSMAILRFYVGTDEEKAVVRTYNKLMGNQDRIPQGVSQPLVKVRSIDDVPILALTLSSARYGHYELRRVAAALDRELKQVPDVSETTLIGGQRRQIRVTLDAGRLAGYQLSPLAVAERLGQANQELPSGSFSEGNRELKVRTGRFLTSAEDVGRVVVGVSQGRPVYASDVATVADEAEEPANYVFTGLGEGAEHRAGGATPAAKRGVEPAVTLSVAKRKGTNAV
ncbi:MAG TPA: efflux RND transporter permease subunit, partial [Armatimonadota bacterium]